MPEALTPDRDFVRKLTDIVLENLENENFGVNDLARESGLSLYIINRKLYALKKIKVSQFIREVRLKRAMELLKNGTFTASVVSYKVGFGSPAYFNKCFREFFGCTPGEVKKANINGETQDHVDRISADESGQVKNPTRRFHAGVTSIILITAVIGIAGYLIYNKLHKTESGYSPATARSGISLVVMPFRNMTGDTVLTLWEEGIQQGLISSLSNVEELIIRQKESVNSLLQSEGYTSFSSISPGIAGKISKKLVADMYVYGSIVKTGKELRIDAQLIDTKKKEVLHAFQFEKPAGDENFFQAIDTISKNLGNYLLISKLIRENPMLELFPVSTNSPDALRYSIYGSKAREQGDFAGAVFWYSKSLEADSNFIDASFGLENANVYLGNLDMSRQLLVKNYSRRADLNPKDQIYASWAYSFTFEAPEESIKYLKQLQEMDDQWPRPAYLLGIMYNITGQYYNAITEFQKAFALYKKWGKGYLKNNSLWEGLGLAYHKTGQFEKEKKLYRKALRVMPDEPLVIVRQALLSYSEQDTVEANRHVEKFISVLKKRGYSEAHQLKRLGDIYAEAGLTDMAEKYYRQSLSLESSNISRSIVLAGFFIDNNRNLDEALTLIDKAIGSASSPSSYFEFMDMKGRCLLKQGRNTEALEILEKTYNSIPYKVWYIYSDLMKAREAIGNLN